MVCAFFEVTPPLAVEAVAASAAKRMAAARYFSFMSPPEGAGAREAIPSERRLSTDLGVSRLTLRAALDELVREGYLVRRHGSGTFVSEPKIAQQLTLTSFTEDMRRRGMIADSRTISLDNVHA